VNAITFRTDLAVSAGSIEGNVTPVGCNQFVYCMYHGNVCNPELLTILQKYSEYPNLIKSAFVSTVSLALFLRNK
jgi:hypothetical protein